MDTLMQAITQAAFALISIDHFGVIPLPASWPSALDCPVDRLCCDPHDNGEQS